MLVRRLSWISLLLLKWLEEDGPLGKMKSELFAVARVADE